MKRFAAVLVVVAMLLLTGCEFTSSTKLMCVSRNTSTSFSMSYARFSGTEKYTLRTRTDNVAVDVEIESEDGTLGVKILDADNAIVYENAVLETGSFTIILPESGKYTVRMEAQDHVGSYSFDWGE